MHSVQDILIGAIDPRINLPKYLCIKLKAGKQVKLAPNNDLSGIRLEFLVVADVEDQTASSFIACERACDMSGNCKSLVAAAIATLPHFLASSLPLALRLFASTE